MESRFVMSILNILEVREILYSFRLILEGIPESSRLELEKLLANSFALSHADDNTSGPLCRGGICSRFTIVENTINNS